MSFSDWLQAEECQKKRRAQEGNDKGDGGVCSPQDSLQICNSTNSLCSYFFSALHPPVSPDFCPAFSSIVRLLCCDIFIHVLRRVLQRAAEDRATHWTEAMIQRVRITPVSSFNSARPLVFLTQTTRSNKTDAFTTQALHLIGQALLEEKTQLERSTVEEVTFDFSLKAHSE